ncbi:MAG: hypothetical protein CVV13_14605 [Gammaproteobacteria bacterium HGW-Gammaproteobacteria-3]|nr:MAG: hypothetical protein CVV13_14605 [Gammaproteobacteria bacterium HGW-Gammaproteobacteria-3]
MTLRKNLWDSISYNGFYPVCRHLPLKVSYQLATAKGMLDSMLDAERIERINSAMQQAFGEQKGRNNARQWAKYHVCMLSREIMDVFWLEKIRPETIDRFITLKGLDNYLSAKATGRPVILYTAHFGRLIMPAIALGIKGHQTSALTAPVGEDAVDSCVLHGYLKYKIARMQAIMQGDFISSADSMRALYRILQRGETLIVLIDVAPLPGQPFYEMPFLHGVARFPKGIVKLAMKTGALLVPYFTTENENGLVGEFLPMLDITSLDEQAVLQAILSPVEKQIFRHPEQWWMWPWLNAFWTK